MDKSLVAHSMVVLQFPKRMSLPSSLLLFQRHHFPSLFQPPSLHCYILSHPKSRPLQLKKNEHEILRITRVSRAEELISAFDSDADDEFRSFSKKVDHEADGNDNDDEDFPLVVEDYDSSFSDTEDDGWGFPASELFNPEKMEIKDDEEEEDIDEYLPLDDVKWGEVTNPNYPVEDLTAKKWEDTVRNLSPVVVLAFERYRRPFDNMKARTELDEAIKIFWDSDKPAPRAVKFDAALESKIASALKVKDTPVLIFMKYGKIILRLTDIPPAAELAKIMAHFYCGAVKPLSLKDLKLLNEEVPAIK